MLPNATRSCNGRRLAWPISLTTRSQYCSTSWARSGCSLLTVETRIAIALGVVAVMVFKPALLSSLVTLGVASALGVGVSLVAHGMPGDVRGKVQRGSIIRPRVLETISGSVPDPTRLIHLQFRRFAGCPVCNLHLRSIVRRYAEIMSHGIREVVVFHSSRAELLKHAADLPFAVISEVVRSLMAQGTERVSVINNLGEVAGATVQPRGNFIAKTAVRPWNYAHPAPRTGRTAAAVLRATARGGCLVGCQA
jgi:hypothetical protein